MGQRGLLSGRVALLTGADPAGTMKEVLLAQGARVAVAGATADLTAAATSSSDPDDRVLAVPCHPGDPAAVGRAVGTVVRRLGRLDHLVNLVAVPPRPRPLIELDPQSLRNDLQRDLVTPLTWIRHAHRRWMAHHSGTVVTAATDVVRDGAQGTALAALTELTEWLAAELAPRVDVHAVVPSPSHHGARYRAHLADALPGLLTHAACSGAPGGGAPGEPVPGPVLVLSDRCAPPSRAA
ncbi:SDR family oxidoreductase [Streptomyces caeni]|uniref:SDR family oxidoreductase n=1 Tax=Streptomyces caeni TaxID=2307231 RepID=A0ABW4IK93_9ACTN